jgi:acyl-CoA thioester hydrolase
MRFHEEVQGVYFDDLDPFGILHNARYILLFERTIGAFWRKLGWSGPLDVQTNPDQFHLVRVNHVDYLRPVVGVGQVRVRVWIERLGNSSLTFGLRCLAMDEDLDFARGSRVIVKVHPETRAPERWSNEVRQRLDAYRADALPV